MRNTQDTGWGRHAIGGHGWKVVIDPNGDFHIEEGDNPRAADTLGR